MKPLKPCPFCGRTTVKILPFGNNKFIISHWYEGKADCPIATADKETGIGTTCFYSEEEAIDSWNKRKIEVSKRIIDYLKAKHPDIYSELLDEMACDR